MKNTHHFTAAIPVGNVRRIVLPRRQLLVAVCLMLMTGESLAFQAADPRVGQKVIVTTAGAELRTPQALVWRAFLGEVYQVKLTNGEWLWIEERGGWLWEKNVAFFDTAVADVSRKLTTAPTAENFHLRGVVMLAHGRLNEAIEDFSESLRRQANNPGAFNNRGQAYYFRKDYASAIQDFSTAITQDPKSFIAYNNRALAEIELNQMDKALADLDVAIKLLPDYAEALNNRGVVFRKTDKLNDAIKDFSAALKANPRYADALGNRSYALRLQRNYTAAVADLNAAIEIAPTMFEASNDLAWILATCPEDGVRDGKRAVEMALKACALTEYKEWNALDTLAAAYAESGDFDEAKRWIGTALPISPAEEKERLQKHAELIEKGTPIREE
ncbi:MAG: tetratricopeptide repeat protein [Planctomycetaceae bacterium]|nr:tetratricopeptide repeat protein [Planctomycetaceae bacterium]